MLFSVSGISPLSNNIMSQFTNQTAVQGFTKNFSTEDKKRGWGVKGQNDVIIQLDLKPRNNTQLTWHILQWHETVQTATLMSAVISVELFRPCLFQQIQFTGSAAAKFLPMPFTFF